MRKATSPVEVESCTQPALLRHRGVWLPARPSEGSVARLELPFNNDEKSHMVGSIGAVHVCDLDRKWATIVDVVQQHVWNPAKGDLVAGRYKYRA